MLRDLRGWPTPAPILAAAAALDFGVVTYMIVRRLHPPPPGSRAPPQVTRRMAAAVLDQLSHGAHSTEPDDRRAPTIATTPFCMPHQSVPASRGAHSGGHASRPARLSASAPDPPIWLALYARGWHKLAGSLLP